ncbi:MAG: lasso peptide isopeptide bond-forming cyclase [Brasilonema angustatum HA4187-MV1]|jgi:asparagine synthase (glutamine-hydrolysing)|nr:lasso peptide isopeptide bond-forming cyclase [Brasilonema angustatum HA4187-MV1]
MSGIMGIYYLDNRPVDREDLGRMVDILAHRGHDGADIWVDGSVGLGHRMLWTTPESLLEKLPLINQTGDLAITADCRIDNRDELIHVLQFDKCPSEKITDSQLILAAYEKWGESCPEHLLGDFAFAIWDKRNQMLFCARDHMGVKPLYYYYQTGRIFAFGSEIKALLCLQEIPHQLNEVKVADYLAAIFNDKSITFYQHIYRLPPASYMTLSAKGIQIGSYWSLDPCRELRLGSDEEYASALREIFTEAVRCRLRSAFPVGSHLSGGLDSSSVTCTAQQLLMQEGNNRSLHTFSNIFDAVTECDERPFIEAVLAQGGMIPHYVHADQQGPLSNLDKIFQYHDGAIPAPTHFLVWGLNEATHKEGVRVVLDGFDGDNTLSHGEAYLTELVRKGQWSTFAKEVDDLHKLASVSPRKILQYYAFTYLEELARSGRWVTFARQINQILQYFNVSRRSLFVHHGFKPLLPQPIRQAWQLLRGHNQPANNDRNQIVKRKFAKHINLKKRIQVLKNSQSNQPLTEREQHWRGLTSGVLTQALEVSDQYSAAFSIETRHPFMDKRLIEFCLSLPPEQKFRQSWSRFIMRRAMSNVLPEQVQWRRSKGDMSSSFLYGLLEHNREHLDRVMQNHLHSITDYVDVKALRKIYEELISIKDIQSSESVTDLVFWQVAMLAFWLDHTQLKQ